MDLRNQYLPQVNTSFYGPYKRYSPKPLGDKYSNSCVVRKKNSERKKKKNNVRDGPFNFQGGYGFF